MAPKPKFSFKSRVTTTSTTEDGSTKKTTSSFQRAARPVQSGYSTKPAAGAGAGAAAPQAARTDSPTQTPRRTVIVKEGVSEYRFANSNTVAISNHHLARVILPPAPSGGAQRLASVTDLRRCVVDISGSSPSDRPLASLALKNIRDSLIICGRVDGAAHVTDVKRSTVVVRCHQFRMHDSQDVDVYLSCRTRPVIEYSAGLRFAPMPEVDVGRLSLLNLASDPFSIPLFFFFAPHSKPIGTQSSNSDPAETHQEQSQDISRDAFPQPQPSSSQDAPEKDGRETDNQWNQIADFNWLKPTTGPVSSTEDAQRHSPNWAILPTEERLAGGVFEKVIRKLHSSRDDSSSGRGGEARDDEYHSLEDDEEEEEDDDDGERKSTNLADGAKTEADAENDKKENEKEMQEAREVETMLDQTVPRLRPRRPRS